MKGKNYYRAKKIMNEKRKNVHRKKVKQKKN